MLKSIFNPSPAHTHGQRSVAVDLRKLSVRFDGHLALEDVSLQVEPGLRVAVVGPNGAGKSTLFNVLAGLLLPSAGQVRIYGHAPAQHHCLAYVPQSSQVDWTFPVSVRDVVMMGRSGHLGLLRWPGAEDRRLVDESLARVGLTGLAQRQIGQLSGGQRQRMFIARALAQGADLLLLDEPLAGLDIPSQEQIVNILDELRALSISVLFATHDLGLAAEHFDRILLLNRRLVAYGPPEQVLSGEHLTAAYGGHMQAIETKDGRLLLGDSGGHTHV
ncbi:MAG: metal ABC transporter ATP-binding protein [Anaerolineales bacterium]|nr:metal ABC transporter ATP-binding protein [Anaerolineales bacterium]MCW5855713.1 metal ABC transporter ATP-binding protein [Anaerolineales bacterium]